MRGDAPAACVITLQLTLLTGLTPGLSILSLGTRPGRLRPGEARLGTDLWLPCPTPAQSMIFLHLQTLSLYLYYIEHSSFGPKPKATHDLPCPLCNVTNPWLCITCPGHGDFLRTNMPVWVLL